MSDEFQHKTDLEAGSMMIGFLNAARFLEETDAKNNETLYRAVEMLGREAKRTEELNDCVTDLAEKLGSNTHCCCCRCCHK